MEPISFKQTRLLKVGKLESLFDQQLPQIAGVYFFIVFVGGRICKYDFKIPRESIPKLWIQAQHP